MLAQSTRSTHPVFIIPNRTPVYFSKTLIRVVRASSKAILRYCGSLHKSTISRMIVPAPFGTLPAPDFRVLMISIASSGERDFIVQRR